MMPIPNTADNQRKRAGRVLFFYPEREKISIPGWLPHIINCFLCLQKLARILS